MEFLVEESAPPGEQAEYLFRRAIDSMLADPTLVPRSSKSARSAFGRYVASEARIPIEQSPVEGKLVTEILAGSGMAYGVAQGEPMAVILGLGAIILVGPAQVIGEWGTAKLRQLLGLP